MSQPVDNDPQALAVVESVPSALVPAEPPRRRRYGGCVWILGGLTGCLLCPLILLALPVLLGMTTANHLLSGVEQGIQSVIHPAPPVASTTSTQTIIQSVLPLGQLVSVSVQLAKADIEVGIQQGSFDACGFSAQHVATGAVEAGIDMTRITPDDVHYDAAAGKYVITLPAPQLTSCRIDFIRQYGRSLTACNVDWDEARVIAGAVALQSFRQDALEGGILTRAQTEATATVGAFIQALTGKPVEIHFADATGQPLPASCQPQPPEGWVYHPDTNAWTKGQ